MRNVYSVQQVNAYIKNMFTQDFMLNRIYVKGEVSNCKYHTSGHIYFSLKDESGMISCIMFASQRKGLAFQMRNGQQVILFGNVSTYERDGTYQLLAKQIILDGAGILYERFEALKLELEQMGMFAEEYKQPIPTYATRVGVVTAPTGAAIRDIIQVAKRRNPYVQLVLYPALVQGDGAADSIVKGIQMLEQKNVDIIIVGRGGGSIEELWAFNEESVARAIFHCNIPIISAVGHETDVTIADYVADLRAPTPSAAAELAVFDYSAFASRILEQQLWLRRRMEQKLQLESMRLQQYEEKLQRLHPRYQIQKRRQDYIYYDERIRKAMERKLHDAKHRMAMSAERMNGLSPLRKLSQGFSFVTSEEGHVVKSVADVKKEEELRIFVTDGVIHAKVLGANREDSRYGNK